MNIWFQHFILTLFVSIVFSKGIPAAAELAKPQKAASSGNPNFCKNGNGLPMNPTLAGQFIQNCAPENVEVIRRENKDEDWSSDCEPKAYVPGKKSWKACPPYPFCKAAEAKIIRNNDAIKLGKAQVACGGNPTGLGKPGTPTPDEEMPKCSPELPKESIDTLVVHQSAGTKDATAATIQSMHKKERGWSDLGYHFIIGRDQSGKWKIFEGRSVRPKVAQGAHVGTGLNEKSLGIMIAGNYSEMSLAPGKALPAPPAEALILLNGLVKKLKSEFPVKRLVGHGAFKDKGGYCDHKSCPGEGCEHLVKALQERYFSDTTSGKKQGRKL